MDKSELIERLLEGAPPQYAMELLIRQAYIDGWTNVGSTVIVILLWCRFFTIVRRKTTPPSTTEQAEWCGEDAKLAYVMLAISFVTIATCIILITSDTLMALVNPECWALVRR
jgi:hypothetical protein